MQPAPLLQQLIRAAGRSPDAALDEMAAALEPLGFAPHETTRGPRAVMWRRGAPRLALSGHVDIVPDGEGWARDPHGGEIADGAVWGRGACDMLGSVAAFAAAAAAAPTAPCAILLTTDEETRMAAAEGALEQGLLQGIEAVVVGEPTSFAVGIAEKGVLWLRVRAHGRNAHGSMPELGDNAAERLLRAWQGIASLKLDGEHALLGRPTRNLGKLRAGDAVNQVPALAEAEIDLRYLPGLREKELIEALRGAAREPVDIEIISHHAPFETPRDHPLVAAAMRAGGRAIVGLPYGTEASKYAPAGMPCVIFGPGDQALAHTNREHIFIADLDAGARAYAALLEAYAQ